MNHGITRRTWLRSTLGAAVAGAAGCFAAPAPRKAKPNVLLLIVDDLNHALGCYGHHVVKSPNIDRLAQRGVRFERAYCQFPVCNPSRSSFLTGLRPETTGILGNRTPLLTNRPGALTLPHWFRQHGYFTAGVGKVFHGSEKFDDPKAWDVVLRPQGTPAGRKGKGRNLTGGRVRWCAWRAAEGTDADQADGQVALEAIRLLERKHDKPFFLAVGFHKPHDPFIAPRRYFDLYPLDRLTPPSDPPDASPHLPHAIGSGWKKEFDKFTDRDRREFMRAYYAGISFMDAQAGKMLDALDRLRLADETVILFFSDHGYHLGVHGWWNKNTLFEASCRTPLIAATPEMKRTGVQGRACGGIVEFLDFFPTLCDLCGLPAPPGLQGASFRRLLADPSLRGKDAAFTVVRRGGTIGRAVRTDRWRYIEWDDGKEGIELYDHKTDPGEYHNLAGKPEHANTVAGLRTLLRTKPRG